MARYPDLTVQPLTSTTARWLVPDVYVKQTSGPPRTSTITLANDAELAGIPLDVGTYMIRTLLLATATTGDFMSAWAFTGTWSGMRTVLGPSNTSETVSFANATMRVVSVALGTPLTYGLNDAATPYGIHEVSYNVVVTVAGDMSVRWAQETSDASPTSLAAGSAVEVRRLA